MSDTPTVQPGFKQRPLSLRDKLLLALLPTATVLPTLAVLEALGGHHLLCASMASSAFLIYLDPRNEMNSVQAVVLSQLTASGVGWLMWLLLGGGYAAAACAIPLAILVMIRLKVVHPPAVSTALAFSMRLDPTGNFVLFALAVGITALLVALQRAVSWLLAGNTCRLSPRRRSNSCGPGPADAADDFAK
jgi:CBS-domain-containing membrane protein